jgi:glucokinase
MPKSQQPMALAGDVGGTHTRLGLFTAGGRRPRLQTEETFSSEKAQGPEEIIDRFLKQRDHTIETVCLAIAGPVEQNRVKTTNLPWEVDANEIKDRFGFGRVHLMNDVAATIRAVPLLDPDEVFVLNRGKDLQKGTVGLVAPGTGLGQALMVWAGGRVVALPTEGGHADFAPTNEEEIDLWRYFHERFGHVSIERVVSGPGLANLYAWLKRKSGYEEPAWLSHDLGTGDPPRVIADAALNGRDRLCVDTLDLFVSLLGAVCGNLALTGLTLGGLYLGGGIPPKILPALKMGNFMKAFTNKGRFQALTSRIPVRVILNDKTALLGAADCALSSEPVP